MDQHLEREIESLINYHFEADRLQRSAEAGASRLAAELALKRCKEAKAPLTDRQFVIIKGAILNALEVFREDEF